MQVWIAPRMFEWDDPNAADNGNDSPTGIISQSNKAQKQGVLLGYERFGRLTFQVDTGDDWLTVWGNGDNLQRYQRICSIPQEAFFVYLRIAISFCTTRIASDI